MRGKTFSPPTFRVRMRVYGKTGWFTRLQHVAVGVRRLDATAVSSLPLLQINFLVWWYCNEDVYEACSKEPLYCRPQETKTQYNYIIFRSLATQQSWAVGASSLMELTLKWLKRRELQKQQHHTD